MEMNLSKNPFEYIDAMSYTKDTSILEKRGEFAYPDFLANRHFSYFIDSVFFANMMNTYPKLDNKMKFDFYLHELRSRKRFHKWIKKEETSKIEILKEFYSINTAKAMEIESLFDKETIAEMEKQLETGGKK